MPTPIFFDEYDAAQLAAAMLKLTNLPEDEDEHYSVVDIALSREYHIDLEDFRRLVIALVPFIRQGRSPITGTPYRGFSVDGCVFNVKQEIEANV